jgi:hypothetical protein
MANPPKLKRNEELVKLKNNNPDMSWSEIGGVFRIRKQTAFKIWTAMTGNKNKKDAD